MEIQCKEKCNGKEWQTVNQTGVMIQIRQENEWILRVAKDAVKEIIQS